MEETILTNLRWGVVEEEFREFHDDPLETLQVITLKTDQGYYDSLHDVEDHADGQLLLGYGLPLAEWEIEFLQWCVGKGGKGLDINKAVDVLAAYRFQKWSIDEHAVKDDLVNVRPLHLAKDFPDWGAILTTSGEIPCVFIAREGDMATVIPLQGFFYNDLYLAEEEEFIPFELIKVPANTVRRASYSDEDWFRYNSDDPVDL